MKKYSITNVWVGGEIVEITSTNTSLLESLIKYIKEDLNIPINKMEVKLNDMVNSRQIVNITVRPLSEKPTDSFMFFWAIVSYMCNNGWKPNSNTPDTFSFVKEFE